MRLQPVILSGGCTPDLNGIRYWADAAAVYSTLTLTCGYPKTNIFTYISDGTNPALDAADRWLVHNRGLEPQVEVDPLSFS